MFAWCQNVLLFWNTFCIRLQTKLQNTNTRGYFYNAILKRANFLLSNKNPPKSIQLKEPPPELESVLGVC